MRPVESLNRDTVNCESLRYCRHRRQQTIQSRRAGGVSPLVRQHNRTSSAAASTRGLTPLARLLPRSSGFTLVEMSIVLIIIGLLVGGILKGQELIRNAQSKSLISQIDAYRAANNAFVDKYGQYPGDLSRASLLLSLKQDGTSLQVDCGGARRRGRRQGGGRRRRRAGERSRRRASRRCVGLRRHGWQRRPDNAAHGR